jgi:hypothetical protein
MLTSRPHLDLAALYEPPAAFLETLVQVLRRNDHTSATCQGLDFQRPVLDPSEEFLDDAHFVDDVQMVPIVYILV